MDTRKYKSPLGRDIGTSKANKGRGWKGLKGQAALALAVSLWIGGAIRFDTVKWGTPALTLNGQGIIQNIQDADGTWTPTIDLCSR